jgi:hypothetical protein
MRSPKDIPIIEIKKVASFAIAQFNINRYIDLFDDEDIIKICKTKNANVFNDMNIVDNDIVRSNFPWEQFNPKRICRIMARLMDSNKEHVLNEIDFHKMHVRIKELKPILLRDPSVISRFKKDLSKISDNEAAFLLELGNEQFLSMIDMRGRKFTEIQQYTICKAYNYRRSVISMFDANNFDGFHVAEIIKKTGRENLDILSLNKMKLIDWINLLSEFPEIYDLMDPLRFKNESIMFLVDLAMVVDDQLIYDMILNSNVNDITTFGWERLVSKRPDLFLPICDLKKFNTDR